MPLLGIDGAHLKSDAGSIKSAADCQLSNVINREGLAEPANDDLDGHGVKICEGALSKWGESNCGGYKYRDDGSLYEVGKDGELISASYVKVAAFSRALESSNWHKSVEFINREGRRKKVNIPETADTKRTLKNAC